MLCYKWIVCVGVVFWVQVAKCDYDDSSEENDVAKCTRALKKQCGLRSYQCCVKDNIAQCCRPSENAYHNRKHDFSYSRQPNIFWNMWYFWFAMILILATCFTGCNYWRRQRQLQILHMQRACATAIPAQYQGYQGQQYGTGTQIIQGPNGQAQIVIPVSMFPQQFRPAESYGDTTLPSYNEVTNEPDKFPCPPAYNESAAQRIQPSSNQVERVERDPSPADSEEEPPPYEATQGAAVSSPVISSAPPAETTETSGSETAAVQQPSNTETGISSVSQASASRESSPTVEGPKSVSP